MPLTPAQLEAAKATALANINKTRYAHNLPPVRVLQKIPSAPVLTTGNLGKTLPEILPRYNAASSPKEVFKNAPTIVSSSGFSGAQVLSKPYRAKGSQVRRERDQQPSVKHGSGKARRSIRAGGSRIRAKSADKAPKAPAKAKTGHPKPVWLKKYQFKAKKRGSKKK